MLQVLNGTYKHDLVTYVLYKNIHEFLCLTTSIELPILEITFVPMIFHYTDGIDDMNDGDRERIKVDNAYTYIEVNGVQINATKELINNLYGKDIIKTIDVEKNKLVIETTYPQPNKYVTKRCNRFGYTYRFYNLV